MFFSPSQLSLQFKFVFSAESIDVQSSLSAADAKTPITWRPAQFVEEFRCGTLIDEMVFYFLIFNLISYIFFDSNKKNKINDGSVNTTKQICSRICITDQTNKNSMAAYGLGDNFTPYIKRILLFVFAFAAFFNHNCVESSR